MVPVKAIESISNSTIVTDSCLYVTMVSGILRSVVELSVSQL